MSDAWRGHNEARTNAHFFEHPHSGCMNADRSERSPQRLRVSDRRLHHVVGSTPPWLRTASRTQLKSAVTAQSDIQGGEGAGKLLLQQEGVHFNIG